MEDLKLGPKLEIMKLPNGITGRQLKTGHIIPQLELLKFIFH